MIVKYLALVFLMVPSISGDDTIHFPRLINTIMFDDQDQEPCETGEVCKNFEECATAIDDWKTTKQVPKTCYFRENKHFVCCKKDGSPRSVGVISKNSNVYPKLQ